MADKQLIIASNGNNTEYIQVPESQYNKVREALVQRPLGEILNELGVTLEGSKKSIDQTLAAIEANHAGSIRDAEKAVNQARFDYQQADNELKEAARAGKYSAAPALEARKVELDQAILAAELQLVVAREALGSDKGLFVNSIANGDKGSGASVAGMDHKSFINIARAILFEELNTRLAVDLAGYTYQLSRQVNAEVTGLRWEVQDAKARLENYRQAAAAHYSGSDVKQTAKPVQYSQDAAAQMERRYGLDQQPQPVAAGPARRPGDWGEVSPQELMYNRAKYGRS